MKLFKVLGNLVLVSLMVFIAVSCEKELNTDTEATSIKLISPAADTEWKWGEECLIKWENGTGNPITADLYRQDEFILNIGIFADMMTDFFYTVPETLEPGNDYYVKLYITETPEISATSSSFIIQERDNLPPSCEIIDPRDGNYITVGDQVHITVAAEDADGEIVAVKFFIDGEYAGQAPKANFVFPWETFYVPIGLHTITAVAVDDDSAESLIAKVNVVLTDGSSPIELIAVPSGNFTMGSLTGDYDEKPLNSVFITHNFYIGKFEITNSQYAEMLNYAVSEGELAGDFQNNITVKNLNGTQKELLDLDDTDCEVYFDGTNFKPETGKENRPVVELTWWGAAFYCNMLSKQLNVNELYDLSTWKCNFDGTGYRLPTEAEWEYAARYNNGRKYPWGDSEPDATRCNYNTNINQTTDVGSYSPLGDTSLGICDMAGNAWEWCNDWYSYYTINSGALVDPTGYDGGTSKILRGGNINSSDYYLRTTYRNCYNLYSGYFYGMRVVLSIR